MNNGWNALRRAVRSAKAALFTVCGCDDSNMFYQIRYRIGSKKVIGRLRLIKDEKYGPDAVEIDAFRICSDRNIGRGYGQKLLDYVLARCRKSGEKHIYVVPCPEETCDGTVMTQEALEERYRRLGFREDLERHMALSEKPLYVYDL